LVICTILIYAWWDLERDVGHDIDLYTDKLDTKLIVTIADGTVGLVGLVPAAYCSIVTPTSVGLHIIST
jgi:hypothetical protein